MSLLTILGIGTFAVAMDFLVSDYDSESQEKTSNDNGETPGEISQSVIKEIVNGVSVKHGERSIELPHYKNYDYKKFSKKDDTLANKGGGQTNEELENKAEDTKYVDTSREFKGLVTDVVVNNYVTTKENLFRFMKLVVSTFEDALTLYAERKNVKSSDLVFVYKGGNVMRLLANEFLIELPGTASREINEFYKNYFKRSDADFAIYINPNLSQYETIFAELTYISFLLQQKIRQHFIQHPTYFFEFDKYNDEAKREILKNLLSEFNKAKSLENEENEDYFGAKFVSVNHRGMTVCENENEVCPGNYDNIGKKDTLVEFTDVSETGSETGSETKDVVVYNISDEMNYIYVQSNAALKFSDAAGFLRYFNLTRTKINFNATYVDRNEKEITRSYGGELIDVSLAHKEGTGVEHFWKQQSEYLRKYTLTYNNEQVSFNAYSISYIVEDLEEVIYKQSERPWQDKKYEKRVNRSFYFYFLDLFDKVPSNLERLEILNSLKTVLLKINSDNPRRVIDDLDIISEKLHSKELLIKNLIKEIIRLYKAQENDASEMNDFNAYKDLLIKNLDVIMNGFIQTEQFCRIKGKGKFDEEKLYNTSVDSLAGGSKHSHMGGSRGGSRGGSSSKKYQKKSRSHGSSRRSSCNCPKCR